MVLSYAFAHPALARRLPVVPGLEVGKGEEVSTTDKWTRWRCSRWRLCLRSDDTSARSCSTSSPGGGVPAFEPGSTGPRCAVLTSASTQEYYQNIN